MTRPRHGAPGPEQGDRPGPSRPGRHHRPSRLRLVWVYPDLLSTYGDRGNLLVLERRARLRGIETEAIEVNADQPVPHSGDIYLMGGGEDLPQILAAQRLRADGGLSAAAAAGAVIFSVCAGYQVMGTEFGGIDGEPVQGLGILNIWSGRGERRGVGEIVADVDPELGVPRLTGFENHQGVTTLGPGVKPLARVTVGVGNGDGTEGAYAAPCPRHLPAWPGACPQPRPGRPAALLGRGPAGPAVRSGRGLGPQAARGAAGRGAGVRPAGATSVHDRLGAVSHDLGQERGRPGDPDSLDRVVGG